MKKLFISLIAIVLLSGCGGNLPSLEDRIPGQPPSELQDALEFTGTIEDLELDIYQRGTHQLRTERDKVIILQSKNINLNSYVDKKVMIKGLKVESIGNEDDIINVIDITLDLDIIDDGDSSYESVRYDFSFIYPNRWELVEESKGVSLFAYDDKWVSIEIVDTDFDLNKYVAGVEMEDGTLVTIAGESAIRYKEENTMRVYLETSKSQIIKIIFNEDNKESEPDQAAFYKLLETFDIVATSSKPLDGDGCGGKDSMKCSEGFRCELSSGKDDAVGVCISIEEGNDCPFVSKPEGCKNHEVAEESARGCPIRYVCSDKEIEEEELPTEDSETSISIEEHLVNVIEKYQDKILEVSGATIVQYEITEDENLIAVIYEAEEEKYKTLYSFTPSANEFNFMKKAHMKQGEERDWEIISGENIQSDHNKTIIRPGEEVVQIIDKDMRLYENSHRNFSLQYPKNWYYRSFGPARGAEWMVGFAEGALDALDDAIITVSIVEELEDEVAIEMFRVTKKRDDESMYVVEGDEELQETIEKMASTLN